MTRATNAMVPAKQVRESVTKGTESLASDGREDQT